MDPVTEPVPSLCQVFISHRGPETKNTLASLIHYVLETEGLNVFLDRSKIELGDRISSAIVSAIQSASVHIAILSPGYADSVWCLEELSQMMESCKNHGSAIIAVFYDVEAADLRHIDSKCYAEAFKKHKTRYRIEKVERWKEALKEAAKIKGETYKRKESDQGNVSEVIDQGEVLKKIVKWVWNWVKFQPKEVASHQVGLDQAAHHFKNTIMNASESKSTKIVTIAGNPGAGKSTLAKYLFYNIFRKDFSRLSFLEKVRDGDFPSLQRQLIRDLLRVNRDIKSTSQGKDILRTYLPNHRVLIVLDQVDRMDQIDSLLDMNEVGCGSLILITSRDRNLLEACPVESLLYEVKPLDQEHARELFCHHAFSQGNPFPGSEVFVDEILEMCGRLPWFLKFWGEHVRRARLYRNHMRGPEYWENQLRRLRNELPCRLSQQLRTIYEPPEGIEKSMFLDICCFLEGEDKDLAVSVLEGLHDEHGHVRGNVESHYVDSLRSKSLIGVDDYDLQTDHEIGSGTELEPLDYEDLNLPPPRRSCKITVQNEVRLLARDLAQEEFRASRPLRLGCVNDIDNKFLLVVDVDSSINLPEIRMSEQFYLPEAPIRGKDVRLFVLEVPIKLSSFFRLWDLQGELVWLRLRNFDSRYFPSAMKFSRLRVLELQCHGDYLEQLFRRFDKASSPSYISTAILSGRTENDIVDHKSVMESILEKFEGTVLESPVRLNNIRPNGAILMCFITNGPIGTAIRISERSNSCRQYDVHKILWEDGSGGRRLHVLMCTENPALEVEFSDNGWMVELDSKTKALNVCWRVILAFRSYQHTYDSRLNEFSQLLRWNSMLTYRSLQNEFTRLRRNGMLEILGHHL